MIATSFCLSAQKEQRGLSNYNFIDVAGGIRIELFDGEPKAEINVIKGELDRLITEVKNGTLHIKFEKNSGFWNNGGQKAEIKLYGAQNIEGIDASSGSRVYSESFVKSDDFELGVSSGARVDLHLQSGSVSASVSSGASVDIEGEGRTINVKSSSGGKFDGKKFKCENAEAKASSGGAAIVWATDSFSAKASSGGLVKYKGDPKHVQVDVGKYSGGNVSKI